MVEEDSVTAWRSRTIDALEAARRDGREDEAQQIVEELEAVHVALGERRTGTREEQTTYLLARRSRTALPELLAAGLDTNEWPPPPSASPVGGDPLPASPDTERRLSGLFEDAGTLPHHPRPEPRYQVRYRPQDRQRYRNHELPWALWDTVEDIPVAYHGDKELCEYQADNATAAIERRRRS
ncbi:hypothetical protein ACFC07_22160 [Streptomyces sp. NPDC056099]|uniref:hypothetical protein n=1 Tax=unclassified Streptomyces TaxID=2593676 RepID=UPI0035DB7FB5